MPEPKQLLPVRLHRHRFLPEKSQTDMLSGQAVGFYGAAAKSRPRPATYPPDKYGGEASRSGPVFHHRKTWNSGAKPHGKQNGTDKVERSRLVTIAFTRGDTQAGNDGQTR